jgi:hypothetical protein
MVKIKKITKQIKIYPYCMENPIKESIVAIESKFKFSNVPKNQIPYGDNYHLVLVIDKVFDSKYLCGRFFKLRHFIPSVINIKQATERDILLLPEEEIKETSHFLWDYDSNVMIGEYNYEGVRHFATPITYYLNNIYGLVSDDDSDEDTTEVKKDLFSIYPIRNPNTLGLLKKETRVKSYCVRIADSDMATFEKENACDVLPLLFAFSPNKKGYLEITIKPKRGKLLNKKMVFKKASDIKKSKSVQSLIIEGEDGKYDILNNNLLFSYLDVIYNSDKRIIESVSFYNNVITYYDSNKKRIRDFT